MTIEIPSATLPELTADPTREELRESIDLCDELLLDILAKRQLLTDKIGKVKAMEGLPVRDIARENDKLRKVEQGASARDLNPRTLHSLFLELFQDSRARQTDLRREIGSKALGSITAS